jgi:murein DD-endopeptidase MepM/ murein hydrolase activator NlpD
VLAARSGMVMHINQNVAASNYGKYVVLRHELKGLPIYTLYAHLRSVRETLSVGDRVKAGAPLGILGRTANTREGISKGRAHLHFEIGVRVNTRFEQWFDRWYEDGKNVHGNWNGMNLLGLDAAEILKQAAVGSFHLNDFLKKQPVLCRVRVHQADFDLLKRFPELVDDDDPENESAIQAWEVALNFSGIPVRLKPIRKEVRTGGARYRLLEVDAKVRAKHPCGGLVFRKGQQWVFTGKGRRAMDLLLFE